MRSLSFKVLGYCDRILDVLTDDKCLAEPLSTLEYSKGKPLLTFPSPKKVDDVEVVLYIDRGGSRASIRLMPRHVPIDFAKMGILCQDEGKVEKKLEVKLHVNPLPLGIRTARVLLFAEYTLHGLSRELSKYLVVRSEFDERLSVLMKDEFIAEVIAKGRLVRKESIAGLHLFNKLKELVGELRLGKALVSVSSGGIDAKYSL